MTTALITGFPRLLARGLALRGLNLDADARVLLLVAPDRLGTAQDFKASLAPDLQPRLTLLEGKTTAVDLSLSGADVRRILSEVSLVFHCDTIGTGPREVLHRHNVRGLANLLGLAADMTALRRVCVFSSAFVSGKRRGFIAEEDLSERAGFNSPWERSLHAAEQVARASMPRLPITILRPSAMIGHSRTGEADGLNFGPNYLVRLMVRMPADLPFLMPGRGVVPFNIVPIDYVVHAAWAIAMAPAARGRTFHLTDPSPVSARQACELLGDLAANRPAPLEAHWPLRLAGKAMRLTGLDRFAAPQMTLLNDLTRQVTYGCDGALEILADTDVACPPFESYAEALVTWVARYEREQRADAPI